MGKFVDFPEANTNGGGEDCQTVRLNVQGALFRNEMTPEFTFCFEFTDDEIRSIIDNDNKVYFTTVGHLPPVRISHEFKEHVVKEYTWEEIAEMIKADKVNAQITFSEKDERWNIRANGLIFRVTAEEMEHLETLL